MLHYSCSIEKVIEISNDRTGIRDTYETSDIGITNNCLKDLEIHGVMRFYFQESVDKVTTKCIRVSSTATTRAVIDVLVDKFHPDLKMFDFDYFIYRQLCNASFIASLANVDNG